MEGSLMAVSKELSGYVGLSGSSGQKMGWSGTEPAGECIFFYGKRKRIMN
jgi:hypothetical protein